MEITILLKLENMQLNPLATSKYVTNVQSGDVKELKVQYDDENAINRRIKLKQKWLSPDRNQDWSIQQRKNKQREQAQMMLHLQIT